MSASLKRVPSTTISRPKCDRGHNDNALIMQQGFPFSCHEHHIKYHKSPAKCHWQHFSWGQEQERTEDPSVKMLTRITLECPNIFHIYNIIRYNALSGTPKPTASMARHKNRSSHIDQTILRPHSVCQQQMPTLTTNIQRTYPGKLVDGNRAR